MGSRGVVSPPQKGAEASHDPHRFQAPESVTSERHPRRARLGRGPELHACWNTGKRVRLPHLELAWLPRTLPARSRSGIIVPLYQRTAVQRNQLRRRIREILRRETLRLLPPVDLVVRARREAYGASFGVLRDELNQAAAKIK